MSAARDRWMERLARFESSGHTIKAFCARTRAATLNSLVGSCRYLGIDARAYLRDVLPALQALGGKPTSDQLNSLLPDVWTKRQTTSSQAA